jgi:hypothetical protein
VTLRREWARIKDVKTFSKLFSLEFSSSTTVETCGLGKIVPIGSDERSKWVENQGHSFLERSARRLSH